MHKTPIHLFGFHLHKLLLSHSDDMHKLYSLRNMEVGASREDREYESSHQSPYLISTWLLLSCLSQDYTKAQLNGTVSSLVTTVKLGDLAKTAVPPGCGGTETDVLNDVLLYLQPSLQHILL